jgi:predicted transcriptional regulator
MVALARTRRLDLAGEGPDQARLMIKGLLDSEPEATRKVYAALAHKVWSLLIERRLDSEVRDWHSLLQNTKASIQGRDSAAAERLTALGDLLRESISLAESSPARDVAQRPQARRILELLQASHGFVSRRDLQQRLQLKSSHLSNVLTQLVAHGLVERRDRGKEADFSLTRLGRELVSGVAGPRALEPVIEWQEFIFGNLVERVKAVQVAPMTRSEVVPTIYPFFPSEEIAHDSPIPLRLPHSGRRRAAGGKERIVLYNFDDDRAGHLQAAST